MCSFSKLEYLEDVTLGALLGAAGEIDVEHEVTSDWLLVLEKDPLGT